MATANEQILTALNNQSLTAEGLYKALRSAHGYAVSHNESITYPANRTIYLTVPTDEPYSMPLPLENLTLQASSDVSSICLFKLINDVQLSDALSPTLGDVSLDITSFTQSGGGSACLIDSDHIISLKSKGSIAIKKKTLGSSLIPVHL